MYAIIAAIEYYLPETIVTTEDLAVAFPDWAVKETDSKTGIEHRHIAASSQCASDLAFEAASKIFKAGYCDPAEIDYLMLCTQSPDYLLPTTACLLQERLGIPTSAGALDINLGCSGFVYGLGLAVGLIETGQASTILFITAETYSKYIHKADRSCRLIFSDGAAATLIRASDLDRPSIGPFVYGTNGKGGKDLIVLNSGSRRTSGEQIDSSESKGLSAEQSLYMNGPRLFSFVTTSIPVLVKQLLRVAGLDLHDISLFVFHQANSYLLEEIGRTLGIPREKIQVTIKYCGNTVSSTIPIALKHAGIEGKLRQGSTVMLIGFGVGYSWAGAIVRWTASG